MGFRSKWMGAWKNKNSHYATSHTMSKEILEAIPGNFKIIFKRNPKHKEGDNKPSYMFAFADVDPDNASYKATAKDLQFEAVNKASRKIAEMKGEYVSIENAMKVVRAAMKLAKRQDTPTIEKECLQALKKLSPDFSALIYGDEL